MKSQATGTFQVNLTPQADEWSAHDMGLGRMLLQKTFTGPLQGDSTGQMLSFRSTTDGSAGYVAMEKVTGTLAGKQGTFVLQHNSTMARGIPAQSITVIPDSGTGELQGLTGSMIIRIEDGKHFYDFEYELPTG